MNWPTVALGDICSPKQHKTIPTSALLPEGYPVYGANGQIGYYSEYTHSEETVAITCRGATCGTINVAPRQSYITGNAMALDNLNRDRVDLRFFVYALRHRGMHDVISGSAQPQITRGPLLDVTIPLPPLDEQRRIAAILDQADGLREQRQKAIGLLSQLSQAIFYEMFGDPSINPMNWPIRTIGDLAASTQYGTSGKAGDVGQFPILRMGNISSSGEIRLENLKYIDFADRDVEKYTVRTGDVLFNRTNSPDLVGKTGVYYGDSPIGFAGYLVRLRVNKNSVPEYISAFLNSPYGKKVLRGMCKAIIGMANINAQELRSIRIPAPPIELQRLYQNRILGIRSAIDAPMKHQAALESLFQALQNRAFKGEL